MASPLSYLCLSISGTASRATAAAAATLEPEAAPNPAQAQLAAMASPPGSAPNQAWAARNSDAPMPELLATAPISRNIGIADRSQLAANTNGASLITDSATLMSRRYQNPAKATAPMATPIGKLEPDQDQHRRDGEQRKGERVHQPLDFAADVANDAQDEV